MENFLTSLRELSPLWIYIILFLSAFFENIFPPIPGDSVVVIGAYLVGIGKLNIYMAFILTTMGSISGFFFLFLISYRYGESILEKKFLKGYKKTIFKVEKWFKKYGYGVILVNRFLSGARSVISIFAGISKLNPIKVFFYATIGCGVWNFFLIYTGYKLGSNWKSLIEFMKKYNKYTFFAIILVLSIFITIKLLRKKINR